MKDDRAGFLGCIVGFQKEAWRLYYYFAESLHVAMMSLIMFVGSDVDRRDICTKHRRSIHGNER